MRDFVTSAKSPGFLGKVCVYGGFAVLLFFCFNPAVGAASGSISQGYETNSSNITKGALLSLSSAENSMVEPANSESVTNLVGVAADDPLIELSDSVSNTRVVVSGTTEALVSDVNGEVKAGDKITASPIGGIGMKAVTASEIVGTAQVDLSSVTTVDQTVTTQNDEQKTIKVGLLPVAVNVTFYSAPASQGALASFVPPFLQSVANTVAGKQVSPLRILFGVGLMLLGFVAVIAIMQTAIRNGLISIGRNPLAQGALRKGLLETIIAALGLLVVMTVGAYAILVV